MARYGEKFKQRAIARLLPPESSAISTVSQEMGISVATLERWRADALFRTAKYRPEFPTKGFADLQEARLWASSFVRWYNNDHHHSGIRYVSPAQRHAGLDRHILAARHELYVRARAAHPRRWSRHTRNWSPITVVTLNPERESVINATLETQSGGRKRVG